MEAMHKAVERSHFYPDGGGFHLRNAIAEKFGLGKENVVLGNGSNEIIELLFHTFTRPGIHEIVTARHAFAVYTLMAQLFGVRAIVVDDVDFTPDLPAMLRAVTPQTRLIFLASPNNPTGTRVTNEALDAFLRDLPPHVIAVLDEAYYEFLDNPPDTVGYVKAGARVVLMRTFSKIQGLAGLRIGYGLASAEIADLLQRARQPFNANSIAQAGAIAGLADDRASAQDEGHHRRRPPLMEKRLRADGAEIRALCGEFRARSRRRRRRGLQAPDEEGHHRALDGELSPARLHPRQHRHAGAERGSSRSCPARWRGSCNSGSRRCPSGGIYPPYRSRSRRWGQRRLGTDYKRCTCRTIQSANLSPLTRAPAPLGQRRLPRNRRRQNRPR
jgi:histidinol-phosphate aminotransferase